MSGNQALNVNSAVGNHANLQITTHGSDWYYAVCAVMAVSTLVFMGLAMRRRKTHRLFHYITAAITAVACISYWSMGSDLGQTPIQAQFIRHGSKMVSGAGTREIFYVRYIDWFVTTPLLLLDLLLTAGLPWPTILVTLLADEIMIVCGLVGALTQTSYKWGYWVFGMFAFFFVVYELLFDARRHATVLGGSVQRTFLHCGVLTIFLWFLYPIAWGISEGGNLIHPDSEAIFYGVLDILAKPVFGALLIFGHRTIDPGLLGLNIREPGRHVLSSEKDHFNRSGTTTNDGTIHEGVGHHGGTADHHGIATSEGIGNTGMTSHGAGNSGLTGHGIGNSETTGHGFGTSGTTDYGSGHGGTVDHGIANSESIGNSGTTGHGIGHGGTANHGGIGTAETTTNPISSTS